MGRTKGPNAHTRHRENTGFNGGAAQVIAKGCDIHHVFQIGRIFDAEMRHGDSFPSILLTG